MKKKTAIIVTATAIVIGILVVLFGTQSGRRAVKTFFSDFGGGLNRTLVVYDYNGQEVKRYEGNMDIEYEDNRVLFDDADGKRHQIVGGIVIVDEK